METIEILAGGTFANAVKSLGLTSAKCTYHHLQSDARSLSMDYQVWLLSKDDFDNLCAIDDSDWKREWGWWRHCIGSNMTSPPREYIIHGEKIMAWDGRYRENFFREECVECGDYYQNYKPACESDTPCFATADDQLYCCDSREYQNLLFYFWNELGASTEKNICALATHLAQINHLTLSELFQKYLG